jgi:glutamate racemase
LSNSLSRRSLGRRRDGPIGIFDSGIGGLSVALEIRRQLPHEDLLYVADSGHAPYGDRPRGHIEARAMSIVEFFERQNAKAVVVACNTATAVAVDALRGRWPEMPIVAIEPAVKPAAAATTSGVVGVLATTQTIASTRFERLAETFAGHAHIVAQPCPGLAEQVEAGALAAPETRALVERYVRPLIDRGADTIVLGCTHYPFLREVIASVAGPAVAILDPAAAVARELRRRLGEADLLRDVASAGMMKFWTSGPPERMHAILRGLGLDETHVEPLPDAGPAHP